MSSLRGLYGHKGDTAGQDNLGVDYVICFKVPPKERAEAEAGFVQVVESLTRVGLATEVRSHDAEALLLFVKVASADLLARHVYRSRLQDWLGGVRTSGPESDVSRSLREEPVTEAERLRIVYQIITRPANEGGAGVTESAKSGPSKHVAAVFPLHDQAFNKAWIQKWSKKYTIDQADIDEIRDKFGEDVAFYFAFLRSYFRWLIFPSAFGFACWLLLGQFSYVYTLGIGLWSVVFLEYWKQKEVDLAVQWGVRGVSAIQQHRPEFKWDFEAEDAVTGEPKRVYPQTKRLQTQLLQIPFALACVVALGGLVVICNSLEIFINEVYDGPFKQYLGFLPTILLVVFTPTFSAVLMGAANVLTDKENYETTDSYHAALVQKQFVLNFMTSYMALFFTAFVYTPFGHVLLPVLEFWRKTAQVVTFSNKALPTQKFHINAQRITSQMFYFTVTAQIVNFATEVIVPYVTHKATAKAKELQGKKPPTQDAAEEVEFLKRVRDECELEVYDVTGDYREMVMQFGYLSLFSVAWPLAACCFLVNNWVELRSDALKIAISCRRPIPWRSDSIGPWLTAIGFLSWLGSVTSSAIVYLCSGSLNGARGTTSQFTAWGVLLSILLAEHFYLAVQQAVRYVMSKVESPGLQRERKERYLMKKKLIHENLGEEAAEKASAPGVETTDKITRASLEEEARQASVRGQGTAEELFWQHQRGMQETIIIGRRLIEQGASETGNKQGDPAPSPRA
ncbi:plasma membrane channel protein [Purpureocillium lavendulum]|uniref:Plasma membrane channel protein n=1 Tax=Purpureocillium lavendulum TaxID=1247861 RepID=A0AB34G179_9HYPO|nr:plasma membrane channel protein [Purpureocillium lavendulum]